jgi:hypothetical protein
MDQHGYTTYKDRGFISKKQLDKIIKLTQEVYIETGTDMGAGVKWATGISTSRANNPGVQNFNEVHSIEILENIYNDRKEDFKNDSRVKLHLGDSRTKFPEILNNINKQCFIFLDAHGNIEETGPIPLYHELDTLKNHSIKNHIIVIDDLRRIGDQKDEGWKQVSVDDLVNTLWEVNENYVVFKYNDSLIAALGEDLISQPNSIQIKSKNFK